MQGRLHGKPPSFRYRPTMQREFQNTAGLLDTALELHRKSLRLVPLAGKRALLKDWPNLHLDESDVRSWCREGVNWGIITGDPLVILDTDSDAAEAWVKEKGIDSPVVVRSGGRGLHRYFRCPEEREIHSRSGMYGIKGLDLRGWHSYIVAPGSIHPQTGRRYAYLPGKELTELHTLPVFDPSWMKEIRKEPLSKPNIGGGGRSLSRHIRDVRAYIRGIESIQGQGGDKACFTVACLLVEAGYDFHSAVAEMEAWNEVAAFPLWRRSELEHKVRYAFRRVLGVAIAR